VDHAHSEAHDAPRPDVALITNHGYGGATLPVGGAPDTGGQNLYVNSLALALERLGHRVTIFARGGFPYFGEERIRREIEQLSDHVRYVFVPGGGDEFIRKEDIAVALDEQLDWLDGFIRGEAQTRRCEPWQVYQFINTHYWDAALLAVRLVERWRNEVVDVALQSLLDGAVPAESLEALDVGRDGMALGQAPAYRLGSTLLDSHGSASDPLMERVESAATTWAAARGLEEGVRRQLINAVTAGVVAAQRTFAPGLLPLVAADVLGGAMFDALPDASCDMEAALVRVDTHVWTPHSLGELKDENFRDKAAEVRRQLKFAERRSHERVVCRRTRAFAATSPEIAERLRTHFGVSIDALFYFPPCVDSERFRKYEEDETAATYRYLEELSGVPAKRWRESKIVFETSRMDDTKRKDLLLEAFGTIARQREDAYLIVGGGPRNELFEELERLRDNDELLAKRAFLTGFIPDEHMGPLFSIADVYVSPSEMEGFGMSVAQAAASRTAIVTSELTPFAVEYVPEEAVIAQAGSIESFACGMRLLLDDDDERERRASALAAKAGELEWEALTAAFLAHLRRDGFAIARGDGEP